MTADRNMPAAYRMRKARRLSVGTVRRPYDAHNAPPCASREGWPATIPWPNRHRSGHRPAVEPQDAREGRHP